MYRNVLARVQVLAPRSRGLRVVLAFWLAVAAAVAVRTALRPHSHTVFPIFAASAEHWWNDQSLYQDYTPLDYFRYPPPFAVLITPFSAVGHLAGGVLWTWLGMAVYFAGLGYFLRDLLPADWSPDRRAAFLAIALFGALRGIWNAQSNALAVGLLLLAAAALVRRRWWTTAFLLAGSVCMKLTPLAPALLLCALWPRRLAWRFAAALALGALVPLLTRPPAIVCDHYADWVTQLVCLSGKRWDGFRDGWTAWLALRHLAGGSEEALSLTAPVDSPLYRVVQLLGASAALAWCLWQRRRGFTAAWLVRSTLAAGCAWLMLFGPAVEHATYVFLAPMLAWAALDGQAWPAGRWLLGAALVLVLLLSWGALTQPLLGWAPPLSAALPAGTALFSLWLVGYARSVRPAAEAGWGPSGTVLRRAA
jgi:hypothetical protein